MPAVEQQLRRGTRLGGSISLTGVKSGRGGEGYSIKREMRTGEMDCPPPEGRGAGMLSTCFTVCGTGGALTYKHGGNDVHR